MDGSQFFVVEKEHFRCFHYRHRPEVCRPSRLKAQDPIGPGPDGSVTSTSLSSSFSGRTRNTTHCCVVAVEGLFGKAFVEKYHNKNWSYLDGRLLPGKVRISTLNVTMTTTKEESNINNTNTSIEGSSTTSIPWANLSSLLELNPPTVMPKGNVGTSLSTFMALIQACKLPAHLIKKLQLEFPKSRSSKKYGAVAFEYELRRHGGIIECGGSRDGTGRIVRKGVGGESVSGGDGDVTADGMQDGVDADMHNVGACGDDVRKDGGRGEDNSANDGGRCEENSEDDADDGIPSPGPPGRHRRTLVTCSSDCSHLSSGPKCLLCEDGVKDDDHDAEEWERYEAYQEDVDKQGRCKERLFEQEIEVVWEKGGSGLVFYTDASHWDQQDGDFDEKCSQEDHWDVDMSVYYDPGGGSRDGRDTRAMERERRLREGEDITAWKIGGFEKHTKGFGSKVLAQSGWVAGQGVGASNQGITEPLESDGQLPFVKRGLGYRGEKLERQACASTKKRKLMKDVIISTIYDKPEEVQSTILRSAPPSTLKHRAAVSFRRGGLLKNEEKAVGIARETHHKRIM